MTLSSFFFSKEITRSLILGKTYKNETSIQVSFFYAVPNLECIVFDKYGFQLCNELKIAFKSLVSLKKIFITVEERFEDFIGSKIVEHLDFYQTNSQFVNWNFISTLERLRKLRIRSEFEPEKPFFDFLKLDRLELLSIENRTFEGEAHEILFQTIRPLKNLKTLILSGKYVQNAVLSDKIETLHLFWDDSYSNNSLSNDEIIDNFIRGPGVKYLYMIFPTFVFPGTPQNVDYSSLLTVDLRRYFPLLQRAQIDDDAENVPSEVIIY